MNFPEKKELTIENIRYSPIELYPRLSKGMLAIHYQCSNHYLKKHIMSIDELKKMDITTERYKAVHSGFFTPQETQRICEYLNIKYLRLN